jgi:3',5'-cyclic AMP phosphodiesterase CpdA
MFRLLVLSDLHYGILHRYRKDAIEKQGELSLVAAVQSALRAANATDIDGVLLTGDYFSKHEKGDSDLTEAAAGLKTLLKELKIDVDRVLAIPGNHDVWWTENHAERFGPFNLLCQKLQFPFTAESYPLLRIWPSEDEPVVAVFAVNSTLYEQSHTAGLGVIGESQIASLREQARDVTERFPGIPKIAMIHHQILPVDRADHEVEVVEGKPTVSKLPSVLIDAHKLLDFLHDCRFSALLHGHRHVRAVNKHQDLLGHQRDHELFVMSIGTAGHHANPYRHFSLLEFEQTRITARSFRTAADSGIFQEDSDSTVIPVHDPQLEKLKVLQQTFSVCGVNLAGHSTVTCVMEEAVGRLHSLVAKGSTEISVCLVDGNLIEPTMGLIIRKKRRPKPQIKLRLKLMLPSTYRKLVSAGWISKKDYVQVLKNKVTSLVEEVGRENVTFFCWPRLQEVHATLCGKELWFGKVMIDEHGQIGHQNEPTYFGNLDDPTVRQLADELWHERYRATDAQIAEIEEFLGLGGLKKATKKTRSETLDKKKTLKRKSRT